MLPPDEYGIYTYVIALVTLLQGAGAGWLAMGALRLSEREGKREKTLAAILLYFVGITILTVLILFGLLFAEQEGSRNQLLLVIGTAFFLTQGWYETNLSILRARLLVERYVIYTLARTIVASIFGAWFAWIGWGAEGILIGGVLGIVIPSTILSMEIWLKAQLERPQADDLGDVARFGFPLALGYTVGAFILVTDRFLVEFFMGIYLLGIYGAAYQIADRIIRSIIEPIGNAALPLAINKFEQEGAEATYEQLRQNWSLMIGISLPAVVGLCAVTPSLVEIVVGPDYRAGALQIIPIIALATFVNGIRGGYLDHAYHLGQKTQLLLVQSVCVAVLNVLISIPLILQMGIIGAAYGTLGSQFAGMMIALILGRRSFVLPFAPLETLKVFAATLAMLLCLWAIPLTAGWVTLIIQSVLGGLVYGAVLLALNPFDLRSYVASRLPFQLGSATGNT